MIAYDPTTITRPVLYVAHPVSGDVAANLSSARWWLRWLKRRVPEVAWIAPWIVDLELGDDDDDPAQRERGLLNCEATVERCDGIALVGPRISSGMQRELVRARWVFDLTGEPKVVLERLRSQESLAARFPAAFPVRP